MEDHNHYTLDKLEIKKPKDQCKKQNTNDEDDEESADDDRNFSSTSSGHNNLGGNIVLLLMDGLLCGVIGAFLSFIYLAKNQARFQQVPPNHDDLLELKQ